MSGQDYEQLTLFREDSPASHSVVPGSASARRMTVTSGRKCAELLRKSDPLGCLVKTCLVSSIWRSTRCFLTWKISATPRRRLLFRLAPSMPRTDETASPLWPTPSTGAALCGGTGNFKTLEAMARRGLISEEERRELSKGNGGKTNPGLLEWLMGFEQQFTKLIPTPTQADYHGGVLSRYWTPQRERDRAARVRRFAEEFRGQPFGEAWLPEPGLDRVVDGIPNRVDRIKCLGNAVVPQQFYPFFKAIADLEEKI